MNRAKSDREVRTFDTGWVQRLGVSGPGSASSGSVRVVDFEFRARMVLIESRSRDLHSGYVRFCERLVFTTFSENAES